MKDKQTILDNIELGLNKDEIFIPASYIGFCRDQGRELGKKTRIWIVIYSAHEYRALGEIKWFGRWRKYCFFPNPNTVYEEICMREIAYFCETATKLQRVRWLITKELAKEN